MTDPNSLSEDILKVRQLIAVLGDKPSPILKDLYGLLTKMVAAEEAFLFRRGELLNKKTVADISRAIGLILVDALKNAGIPTEQRQRIHAEVNSRTLEMLRDANNSGVKMPAKLLVK